MTLPSRSVSLLFLFGCGALLATCGGGGDSPAAPPPVAVTPTPVATPTPVPVNVPDPFPGATSCSKLGMGSAASRCRKDGPNFQAELEQAVSELIREKASLFENTDAGLRVTSTGQLYVGLIEKLDKMGLCAHFDGEELGIKNSNDYNDQFHMITSNLILRRGDSAYQTTCYPAAFPTSSVGYFPAEEGCPLPPSREITCGREDDKYFPDVDASLEEIFKSTPQAFDLADTIQGGPRIVNPALFKQALVAAMKKRGYCGRHDDEEFVFKKVNAYSEQYDLESSSNYVRRGSGTYRSTCYPAAF